MTAFARAAETLPQATVAWEIKTVNAKGLDIRLRVPPGLDGEEPALRAAIAATVARGTIQASLSVQRAAAAPEVRIDEALLRSLISAAVAAVPPGVSVGPLSLDGLLAVRGVVEVVERGDAPADAAALTRTVHRLLEDALGQLRAARSAEGEALGAILRDHLASIEALAREAEAAPGRQPAAVLERLKRAVAALTGASPALDPDRLHAEAILLAAKADIREELDRLRIHGAAATALLREGGAVGRRLDFLAQELGREASTLTAKSNDADLTAIGLALKSRIEQFREQVQNLE